MKTPLALLLLAGLALAVARAPSPLASAQTDTAPETSGTPTALELARRHAPLYRFNAWIPGDGSPQNRSEDFFPMSVARFLDALAAGHTRVVSHLSHHERPGVLADRRLRRRVRFEKDQIRGVPARMAGDDPGEAPVYFHVFEDESKRVRHPDGSGEDLFFVEYWLFYPKDFCQVRALHAPLALPIGGHRGDWETVSLAVALVRGPRGVFERSEVRQGFFNRHGEKDACARNEVELVGGDLTRGSGEHPVVYVSVGKHASYPEPGFWHDVYGLEPFATFDEFFLGNGFAWQAWRGALVDLDATLVGNERAFAPPSWGKLLGPWLALDDWRLFPGRWGSDSGLGPLSGSPVGPRQHGCYGEGERNSKSWAEVKREAHGFESRRIEPTVPAPIPRAR